MSQTELQKDLEGADKGGQHRLSIAQTIGATIGAIGLVLLLYGLLGHADYSRSDGININLWWGLVMVIFGLIMVAIGYFSAQRQRAHVHEPLNPPQ